MVITLFLILKTGTQNWTPYIINYFLHFVGKRLTNIFKYVSDRTYDTKKMINGDKKYK